MANHGIDPESMPAQPKERTNEHAAHADVRAAHGKPEEPESSQISDSVETTQLPEAAGPAETADTTETAETAGTTETAETTKLAAAPGQTAPSATDANDDSVLLVAEDMSVDASWGHIYGPVNLTVKRGGVTVVVGHGGRGRTALLLTLAGRMKPTEGSLRSFGKLNDAHHLFKQAALGFVEEVDGIEQAIKVHDIITEQVRWAAKWYRWVPQATQEDLERICRPVFGDLELPSLDAMVEELPELTAALFRIAIANVHKPPLLVVGGVDNLTSVRASKKLLERLVILGREQTVITADGNGVTSHLDVREYIEVPNLTNHEFVKLELEEVRG